MFKYDYLESHPEVNRRQIPWEELLFDEREKIGPRTLRGMIFPWRNKVAREIELKARVG